MAEDKSIIEQTNETLQRYYKSLNKEYEEDKFINWCEDYGVDEDLLQEEAKQSPEESMLVDFDSEFPLDRNDLDDGAKKEKILGIIIKCIKQPDTIWPGEAQLPAFNAALFELEEDDMNRTKQTYETQCPVLWNAGIYSDLSFLQILAVGQKEKFAYLLHLVDDYNKQRIEKMINGNGSDEKNDEDWTEAKWSRPDNHKHFKLLKDIKVNILRQPTKEDPDQNKYLTMDYKELAKMAVVSFSKRCCAKMLFNTMMQIDDSIEMFFKYLLLATDFITNLIKDSKKNQKVLCPFMVDVLLAVGAPKFIDQDVTIKESGDTGSSDEDEEDETDDYVNTNLGHGSDAAKKWVDCIGSVKARLEAQKLNYIESKIDEKFTFRTLGDLFKEFITKHKLKGDKQFDYPYSKRFMILIDRRRPCDKNDEALKEDDCKNDINNSETKPNLSTKRPDKDAIWIYEPPKGPRTRDMPADVVPEWGISASRTSWLPHKDYDEEKAIAPTDWQKKLREIEEKQKQGGDDGKGIDLGMQNNANVDMKNANLNSAFHAKGGLITLSFHVDQSDVIKCYLYWNAQLLRLFPEYMHEIVPRLYTPSEENKTFMTSEHGKDMLEKIKGKLIDRPFKGFLDSYSGGNL